MRGGPGDLGEVRDDGAVVVSYTESTKPLQPASTIGGGLVPLTLPTSPTGFDLTFETGGPGFLLHCDGTDTQALGLYRFDRGGAAATPVAVVAGLPPGSDTCSASHRTGEYFEVGDDDSVTPQALGLRRPDAHDVPVGVRQQGPLRPELHHADPIPVWPGRPARDCRRRSARGPRDHLEHDARAHHEVWFDPATRPGSRWPVSPTWGSATFEHRRTFIRTTPSRSAATGSSRVAPWREFLPVLGDLHVADEAVAAAVPTRSGDGHLTRWRRGS